MNLYTGTIDLAKRNRANIAPIYPMDTTLKSATAKWAAFAPTQALVYGSKAFNGDKRFEEWVPLSWEQYTDGYLTLLRQRYVSDPEPFREAVKIATDKGLCLCCYCNKEKAEQGRCHRVLLADVLVKVGASMGVELVYRGEW